MVGAILAMPPNSHPALRYTAVRLLGSLDEWIDNNAQILGRWECENQTSVPVSRAVFTPLPLVLPPVHSPLYSPRSPGVQRGVWGGGYLIIMMENVEKTAWWMTEDIREWYCFEVFDQR